ncbi:MAG TPA: diacylglycerol kinase family protein [Flavobacteriales bacterium]|nr:diacylglycerol kinase family protein [Flavobacteriales bacterium]
MKYEKFSLNKRLKSFPYAFNGLKILLREEHNSILHLLAATGVVAAGIYFKLSACEWVAVAFAIGLVISLEIINSVIENVADFVSPSKNEKIKKIKDLSAAAVLVSSLTALAIGAIVFVPKIVALW